MITKGRVTVYNTAHKTWDGMKYRSVWIVLDYLEDEKDAALVSQLEGESASVTLNGRYAIEDIPALRAALDEAERIAREWAADASAGGHDAVTEGT